MICSSGSLNSIVTSFCVRMHIENPIKYYCWCPVGIGREVEWNKVKMIGEGKEIFEVFED